MNIWLELLARNASPVEVEAARGAARRDGSSDDPDGSADAVLEILRQMADGRRVSEELAVLNDLARRLATHRERDEVLREVAVQARRLLSADIAYLMLSDASGSLTIVLTEGSIGSKLTGIRIESGRGLAGHVLETGIPYWTEDYAVDSALSHSDSVDEAAASEDLRALLGVPLVLGDRPIGVLLAGSRAPRRFEKREVAMLVGLAAHAVGAISTSETLAQLRQANDQLAEFNRVRQRALEMREQLTSAILAGGGFPEVESILTAAVGRPVRIVAGRDLIASDAARRAVDRIRSSTPSVATIPVAMRGGYVGGEIVVGGEGTLDEEERSLLSAGATYVALVISNDQIVEETELRLRGDFMTTLSSGSNPETVERNARAAGIDLAGVTAVAVFDLESADSAVSSIAVRRLTDGNKGWSGEVAGRILVLIRGESAEKSAATIRAVFEQKANVATVGLDDADGDAASIQAAIARATQTVNVLRALGRRHRVATATGLGMYGALFDGQTPEAVESFVAERIGPVLEFDKTYGRELAHTLLTYFDSAKHHGRTSATLGIHANTLYQRLAQVRTLLGDSWGPMDDLELHVALRINAIRETLR